MLGKENQSRGAGSFAVKEMLRHGFYNLNLQRIELEVLEENSRAIHVYEKCGFRLEGKKRNAVFKQGEFKNVLLYSVLRQEFMPEN